MTPPPKNKYRYHVAVWAGWFGGGGGEVNSTRRWLKGKMLVGIVLWYRYGLANGRILLFGDLNCYHVVSWAIPVNYTVPGTLNPSPTSQVCPCRLPPPPALPPPKRENSCARPRLHALVGTQALAIPAPPLSQLVPELVHWPYHHHYYYTCSMVT